ncbi:hypothetical protein HOY82DRAFT_596306 [Tuber indicum]|nr:hypothetical protein HOY82DRAFT_596306 [Tuber indicum]
MASEILRAIDQAFASGRYEPLVFKQLDPTVSSQVLETLKDREENNSNTPRLRFHFIAPDGYLRVVMPSGLHESAVFWMRNEMSLWIYQGLLTPTATRAILDGPLTHENFLGIFNGSCKIPDIAYIPCINRIRAQFPAIVLESGWSESEAQLLRDCQLWQQGSAGSVKVVLLFKLFGPNLQNQIKASLHLCRYSTNQTPVISSYACLSYMSNPFEYFTYHVLMKNVIFQAVFPRPIVSVADPWITINELFGGRTPNDLNPLSQLRFSLDQLRIIVDEEIHNLGYVPAVL